MSLYEISVVLIRNGSIRCASLGWTDLYDGLSHAAREVASDIVFNAFGLEEEPAL